MNLEQKDDFGARVMGEIKKREIEMKPRWVFTVISVAVVAIFMIMLLLTTILSSFGLFRIRHVNPFGFLHLGSTGWWIFLQIIPWELFSFVVLGILLTWLLARRFDISYKIGFGFLALALVSIIFSIGFLLDCNEFGEQAEKNGIATILLKHDSSGENWAVGDVINLEKESFTILMHNNRELIVHFDSQTKFQPGQQSRVSDRVRIIGRVKDGEFWANLVEREEK
jgi:hypothetical protein